METAALFTLPFRVTFIILAACTTIIYTVLCIIAVRGEIDRNIDVLLACQRGLSYTTAVILLISAIASCVVIFSVTWKLLRGARERELKPVQILSCLIDSINSLRSAADSVNYLLNPAPCILHHILRFAEFGLFCLPERPVCCE